MALIEIEDLSFRYEGRKESALSGTNLRIEEGEMVLLLGPSGSGKSTLALCLNGLIPHALAGQMEGSVFVGGLDTCTTPVSELAQEVGVVFQDPEAQFVTMNVEDEVAFGLENLRVPTDEMEGRIGEALSLVGMEGRRGSAVAELSGGQKQRVALASLLAMRPEALVFDEPTANLDPSGTKEFFGVIEALKRRGRRTTILIEHKLDHLVHLVDRVVALSPGGEVLAEGPPKRVFHQHAAKLIEHGIWMPQVALLAHHLRERGVPFEHCPITIEETESALRGLLPGPPGGQTSNGSRTAPSGDGESARAALEVRDLSFAYGGERVLDRVSLSVPEGDFLAVVGANGAGKTTLARHLAGLIRPARGRVFVGGEDVARTLARDLVRKVGYVFQNPEHQFVADSVEEELSFGLRLLGMAEAEISGRVSVTLERFGLCRHAEANPFSLSHGEKRRLSVATMLAMGQEVLVLDEPTFGQDQKNAGELMALLGELNAEGKTIVAVTHDMSLVAEHARNVAVIAGGRLLYHGPTTELFARPDLLEGARLGLPPLAELSGRLSRQDPVWSGLLTLEHFLRLLAPPAPERVTSGTARRA